MLVHQLNHFKSCLILDLLGFGLEDSHAIPSLGRVDAFLNLENQVLFNLPMNLLQSSDTWMEQEWKDTGWRILFKRISRCNIYFSLHISTYWIDSCFWVEQRQWTQLQEVQSMQRLLISQLAASFLHLSVVHYSEQRMAMKGKHFGFHTVVWILPLPSWYSKTSIEPLTLFQCHSN